MTTIGVLALQGGVREHATMLQGLGATVRLVKKASDLTGLDGLVIPGGESSVIDRLARSLGLADPLRLAIRSGLPALGTCAGLILLAEQVENPAPGQQTFGGLDVTVRRNAFGSQRDSFDASIPVAGVEGEVDVSFIRAPIVVSHAPSVEVIARTRGAIVGVRQGSVTGLSFHPEVTGDDRIHRQFLAGIANRGG
ncbi:pyridoxal 5'-phosphate synthase glutaminase subunit PdxT [Microbacterium nymphoidis]|uniref:pyridoxal 5'-phosphate synthase glutaminase subunit PdxT n=1 Tax=Microbacterium nymphoidis TaxID=2898586 RepID=UPI001E4B554E|nr:pyridoxal 5'-phosphate synthase glutaminase subunit PdxT [Microbacterium nymphoidis]MCD2497462.1 pyridoxal 5'-phosphate synthase glutaminase subunit PdxT [Microbacterium nymphoidis]